MFIITDTSKVRSITDKIIPFQSGRVFSLRAKLSTQYTHRDIFTEDENHRVIFTLDDRIIFCIGKTAICF